MTCSSRTDDNILFFHFFVFLFVFVFYFSDLIIPRFRVFDQRKTARRLQFEAENVSYPTVNEILKNLTSPVLVTAVNYGFLQLLFNLLYSIQRLNIQPNILIICEDKLVFRELSGHRESLRLKYDLALTYFEESEANASAFGSESYLKLVQKRVSYIELLIRNNMDVFYVDADVVLLDDPLEYMKGEEDLFIQSDNSQNTSLCTGFFYMRANNRTRELTYTWNRELARDRLGNQRIFDKVRAKFGDRVKVKILPTDRFFNGIFFRLHKHEHWDQIDPKPVEIHANTMIGYDTKEDMLKKFGLWFAPF